MGVFKLFSSADGPITSLDPNPRIFEIVKSYEHNSHTVILIKYPNCTNYEGNKILVYLHTSKEDLKKLSVIDPHFSEKSSSPFARFIPTDRGWMEACRLIRFI